MTQHEIEISIDEHGEIELETFGVRGPACQAIAEKVARLVGQIQKVEKKSEFYEQENHIVGQTSIGKSSR